MEFLILVCSATLQDDMIQAFEICKITEYTCIPQATGSGKGGGTRLNDEIWPGENYVYMVSADSERSARLKEWVRNYRSGSLREGLKLFSLEMKEMI